jgi:hypothetical protein
VIPGNRNIVDDNANKKLRRSMVVLRKILAQIHLPQNSFAISSFSLQSDRIFSDVNGRRRVLGK